MSCLYFVQGEENFSQGEYLRMPPFICINGLEVKYIKEITLKFCHNGNGIIEVR